MHADSLFQVLSRFQPLSEDFKKTLGSELIQLSLPKHYLLLEAPKVMDHVYFLQEGFAIGYTYREGKKHVESFWKKNQIVGAAKSFLEKTPSQEYIELLTHSEVLCLSNASVLKIFDSFKEAHVLYRSIMHQSYEDTRTRLRDLQRLQANERFDKLLSTYPGIEQLVSQEQIASYLGITPQSLSRIKRMR